MTDALLREWNREKKDWLIQQGIVMGIPLLIFLIYIINKNWLFAIISMIRIVPQEFSAFLGITSATETGNLSFFLLYCALISNFAFIWNAMNRSVRAFYADELSGSVYTMCNQWYSRKQLFQIHYTWSVLSFLAGYLIWYLELVLFILLGSLNNAQRLHGLGVLTGMLLRSVFVGWMLISLITLLAVCFKSGRRIQAENWICTILIGTLFLGNLYKIRDAACWVVEFVERDSAFLIRVFEWLDGLYWISPLTWMNPFVESGGVRTGIIQLVLCTGISIVSVKLAVSCYNKRNFIWG